jgi:predicted metal-dependent phosphoesterase TrpH
MVKADLHLLSNFSDGSETLPQLLQSIRNANIKIFALTDHDTISGCSEMQKLISPSITFIKGIELTCEYQKEKIKSHILGYNYNENNKRLHDFILKGKKLRKIKLDTRIEYLKSKWNIELTQEEIDWLNSRTSVVKTHFANILVNRKLATDTVSAMKKYLDDCKIPNTKFDTQEAIDILKQSKAIPILAHPLGGEGEIHLSQNEFLYQLHVLKEMGIQGLECYYSRYSKEEIEFLIDCAKKNNLLISGGSDYHGKNKTVKIGTLNIENDFVDSSLLTVLTAL